MTKTKRRKKKKQHFRFFEGAHSAAPLRFHLDENISPKVARLLRDRGVSVTTTREARLVSATDTTQLLFAKREWRIIVTQDRDFVRLHNSGFSHAGILFVPIGTAPHEVAGHMETLFEESPKNPDTEVSEISWEHTVVITAAILVILRLLGVV